MTTLRIGIVTVLYCALASGASAGDVTKVKPIFYSCKT